MNETANMCRCFFEVWDMERVDFRRREQPNSQCLQRSQTHQCFRWHHRDHIALQSKRPQSSQFSQTDAIQILDGVPVQLSKVTSDTTSTTLHAHTPQVDTLSSSSHLLFLPSNNSIENRPRPPAKYHPPKHSILTRFAVH